MPEQCLSEPDVLRLVVDVGSECVAQEVRTAVKDGDAGAVDCSVADGS